MESNASSQNNSPTPSASQYQSIIPPTPISTQQITPSIQTSQNITNGEPKRSKKKLIIITFIVAILILLGILFLLDKFTSPGLVEAGKCFTSEAAKSKEIYNKMEALTSQTERVKLFCTEDESSHNRLINCLEQVRKNSSLSMDILDVYPKYKATIQETIDSHNKKCPNSPIYYPKI